MVVERGMMSMTLLCTDLLKPTCKAAGCNSQITTVIALVTCEQCQVDYHKACVGLDSAVTTYSIPFCPLCRTDQELRLAINITLDRAIKDALAAST